MPQPLTLLRSRRLYRWVPALLLAAYAALAAWLAVSLPMDAAESRTAFGAVASSARTMLPSGRSAAADVNASTRPISPVMTAIAYAVPWRHLPGSAKLWLRLPMVIVGLLLGFSLWTIASRWYGLGGGAIALALYCFSPAHISAGARLAPDILAAWGHYGTIFTAIAIAHSLYATPELFARKRRWRNVILFALALGVGFAAAPSNMFLLGLLLAASFGFYLVGKHPGGTFRFGKMLLGGIATAALLVEAIYRFRWAPIRAGLTANDPGVWVHISWQWLLQRAGALVVLFAIVSIAWIVRRPSRWFGNTAPLIALLATCFVAYASASYWLSFAFLFIAGVLADLLHSRFSLLWRWTTIALLGWNAAVCLWTLRGL